MVCFALYIVTCLLVPLVSDTCCIVLQDVPTSLCLQCWNLIHSIPTVPLMCACVPFCRWDLTLVILPLRLSTQTSHIHIQCPQLSLHMHLPSLSNHQFTLHNSHHTTLQNLPQCLLLVFPIRLSLMKWEMLLLEWELQLFKTPSQHTKWVMTVYAAERQRESHVLAVQKS